MSRIDEARACAAGLDMLAKCYEMSCCDCPQEEFSGHVICSDERGFFEHVSVVLLGLVSDLEETRKEQHGEWKNSGGKTFCTVCGERPLYDYFGREKLSRHCWNCGAQMNEEEKEK